MIFMEKKYPVHGTLEIKKKKWINDNSKVAIL